MAAAGGALNSSGEMFSAAGNYISQWGGTGESAGIGGQFTDLLGGGVTALGGDISGLFGLTEGQKTAADKAGNIDVNKAALEATTGVQNTARSTAPGDAFTKRIYG